MSETSRFNATQLMEEEDYTSEFLDNFDEDETEESEGFERPHRSAPVQFPTDKPNRYSKDRRYVPMVKKSDQSKMAVRSSGGKGAKHKKETRDTP